MNARQFAFVLFACAVPVARSQSNGVATNLILPAVTVTPAFVNQLAEEARTNNAALRASRIRVEAAQANMRAVRTWEDPVVYAGGIGKELDMRKDEGDIVYGAEQMLPLFGKPQAERRVADAEASTVGAGADLTFQNTRLELARAAFQLALGDRLVELGAQDLDWLEQLAASTEERYRAGTASQVESLRVQNERAKRATQLQTEQSQRDAKRLVLNRALNRPLDAGWPVLKLPAVAEPIVFTPQLGRLALGAEARLKVLRQEVKTAEAMQDSARRRQYPNVSVMVEARQYSGSGDFREEMALVKLSLPWFNRSRYRAERERDGLRLQAAQQEQQDYEVFVPNEIRRITLAIDSARREALLYRDNILPRAELALASAQAQWSAGRGMFNDVMEARRMLVEARVMEARAVAEQYSMMSELVLCCGLADLEALKMLGVNAGAEPEPESKPGP